ncbi:endonuclease [Chromobacterium amazonense]|uniref:endonuclease n=1 Tax=Chromobacterium amazonense TaxID=1382803 RepID=UPI001CB92CE9|nr:endonuclease [Chromobacterium amazonense]
MLSGTGQAAPAQIDKVSPQPLVGGSKEVGYRNFTAAKRILPRLYSGMEVDFYCGCRYQGKDVDWASCGYQSRKSESRASRIEWEHVVPAWVLGHQRQCWQQGGRKNCAANDPLFQMAEGDLNNLVPAVGEVNGDRANFSYGAWEIHPRPVYGQCQSIVDFKLKRFQPREEVRGAAARITLYMHQRYGLSMSRQDKQLMCAWARQYPVDEWERQRNKRIVQWQGEGNFLVSQPEELSRVCA